MKTSNAFALPALALCCALIISCSDRDNTVAEPPASSSPTITPIAQTTPRAVTATTPEQKTSAAHPQSAMAELSPTQGNNVRGKVTFTEVADGVRVDAQITGLAPGRHGFHVHEKGDCSAPDAASAGGHFNPTGQPHSAPDKAERHEGDMGNIEADAQGVANLSYTDHAIGLVEGERSVIGRAVVVHANPDDLTSQPSGNAGPRVACGVISGGGTR